MTGKVYACIDLKSFYASVECRERGLDPLKTHLVVADETRTDGTICLAVSPSLKDLGVPGRPRLFEVKEMIRAMNLERQRPVRGKSCISTELEENPNLALDFIIAPPRMRLYMKYSAEIYRTYLTFVAAEDILVYSIDEVFIDLTQYLKLYQMSAEELVRKMIEAVLARTGITATAGVGTNMYLAKVAMDIVAKHMAPNAQGVRMASLDEKVYRRELWAHQPLEDFWRVGRGYARKLRAHGIMTMGDVARVSLDNEELLFKLFGVNAELLIDHAWGWEPCTLAEAKAYRPAHHSLTEGQVMHGMVDTRQAGLIVREMVDELTLRMVDKGLVTRQVVVMVKYDVGKTMGRPKSKWVRGTVNISHYTASARTLMREVTKMYEKIVPRGVRVRKLNLTANEVVDESAAGEVGLLSGQQLDLFGEYLRAVAAEQAEVAREKREKRVQQAMLAIKKRYGKNAILRAQDYEVGATARERNEEVGGHKG